MSTSALPFELLRLILDHFDASPHPSEIADYSTLTSLCLTSKVFRQIAQPKLFAFVVVEEKGVKEAVSSLLDHNKDNGRLLDIRYLALEANESVESDTDSDSEEEQEEEEKEDLFSKSKVILEDLSRLCGNLEYVDCDSEFFNIAGLSGARIRKLCLLEANVADCVSTFCLPSLEYLSLVNTSFPMKTFTLENFPQLQHLAYFDDRGNYYSDTIENLAQLASQMHSVLFFFDSALLVMNDMPSFPIDSLLVDFPRDLLSFFRHAANRVKHARIGGFSQGDDTARASAFVSGLNEVADIISDPSKSSKLESIYLPPLEAFNNVLMPTFTRVAIARLLIACQKRKIKVVFEEQPIGIRASTQFSEEFIRRTTEKRTEREALANEGGNGERQA